MYVQLNHKKRAKTTYSHTKHTNLLLNANIFSIVSNDFPCLSACVVAGISKKRNWKKVIKLSFPCLFVATLGE